MPDAGHRPVEQVARALAGGIAEAQRVQHGDWPRPHREHVAQDAAHPGGRPLEGLDRARMVVGLDLERDRQAAPHVDGPGVLARAHDQALAGARQRGQQPTRVLVGAMLGPQQREHRQLDQVGLAPELLSDQRVLVLGEAKRLRPRQAGERLALGLGDGGHRAHAATGANAWATDSNSRRPSAEPVSWSTACSGWGISPITLPASLHTPAMSRIDPLGFWPGQ